MDQQFTKVIKNVSRYFLLFKWFEQTDCVPANASRKATPITGGTNNIKVAKVATSIVISSTISAGGIVTYNTRNTITITTATSTINITIANTFVTTATTTVTNINANIAAAAEQFLLMMDSRAYSTPGFKIACFRWQNVLLISLWN